jgi:flagellar hook-associated protein 1 FlgK
VNTLNFGFNTAVRGLLASQRSLYTTNHNINNVNTKGFSRQQNYQRAVTPFELPGVGYLGAGTEIYDIERVRNSYVDFKYWNEMAPQGEWEIKKDGLYELEKLFGEPTNSSFRQYMDDFYGAMENMSENSSDPSFREPVRENALAFTKHINETAARLGKLKKETEVNIDAKVKNINSLSNQIAALNRQIYSHEISGRTANDLRDRRDLLVDELSKIVNVKVDEIEDGKYKVSVSGVTLVDHIYVSEIKVKKEGPTGNPDKINLEWGNGYEVKLRSGELKGLLELYNGDGKNNSYRGIPYYQEKLDEFAKGFADGFNGQHRKGQILGGGEGGDFFIYDEDKGIAANLTLHKNILDDTGKIAAGGQDGRGAASDNRNLLELIAQRDNPEFFGDPTNGISQGTPEDFLKSIISNLAVDSTQGKRMYTSQNIILKNIEFKRESISGVNYDEEMGDIVKYQHSYIAAARMITTVDTIMDVTINRLGLVGR